MLYYVSGPVTVLEPGIAVIEAGGVGMGSGFCSAEKCGVYRCDGCWLSSFVLLGLIHIKLSPSLFHSFFAAGVLCLLFLFNGAVCNNYNSICNT